ncbi:MAG: ATPase, T2SS/T4P/T4SS family, partial [Verrucomicrobiota bacterium]|nr:ATPase, T2SS/T4P/T4SS family [Verrucomicrobiota bacterium]
MFEDHNDTVYEIIKGANLLEPAQLDELNESHLHTGKSLADAVIDSGVVERGQILAAVAEYLGYEYLATPPNKVGENIASCVRASAARMYAVVPYKVSDTSVSLLAQDPFNPAIIDDLTFTLNKDITIVVCNPEHIDSLLIATYGEEDSSIDDILGDLSESFTESKEDLSEGDLTDMANQTPIIRFVNLVLQQAIKDKASDVHFEPFEDQFRIRYRIDGALYEMAPPPKNLAVPVTSRVKVLSNMNISERRVPQDGRIKMTI